MSLTKKCSKLERQINVKVSDETYKRYQSLRDDAPKKGCEFSLQPEFSEWLNGYLATCEKELAKVDKAQAKQATEAGASE